MKDEKKDKKSKKEDADLVNTTKSNPDGDRPKTPPKKD